MSKVYINDRYFPTLVARTPEEHSRGLMFKPFPTPVMCFPYNTASVRKFWMKNTISPLDIIFCKKNKIIAICAGKPLSTELVGPNEPSDLVIEMPLGTAAKNGFKVGDSVRLEWL